MLFDVVVVFGGRCRIRGYITTSSPISVLLSHFYLKANNKNEDALVFLFFVIKKEETLKRRKEYKKETSSCQHV